MAATSISNYLGVGDFADRPADPDVPAGVLALYYAVDTEQKFAWNGSDWDELDPAAAASLDQVQAKVEYQANMATGGCTFSAPPTPGNLIIAFTAGGSLPVANTGWTTIVSPGGNFGVHMKVAGMSETAAQNPITNTDAGTIGLVEMEGWLGMAANSPHTNSYSSATSTTPSVGETPLKDGYALSYFNRSSGGAVSSADQLAEIESTQTAILCGKPVDEGVPFTLTATFAGGTANRRILVVVV